MDINFNINEDFNKLQLTLLKKKLLKVYKGGGASKIEKHKAKGKLTARERIDYLLDEKSESDRDLQLLLPERKTSSGGPLRPPAGDLFLFR